MYMPGGKLLQRTSRILRRLGSVTFETLLHKSGIRHLIRSTPYIYNLQVEDSNELLSLHVDLYLLFKQIRTP